MIITFSSHLLFLTEHAANGLVEAPLKQIERRKDLLLCVHVVVKGWFSLAHKHNISITSENTRDISRNIRRTNRLICLMLFSLAHKHKHRRISISVSARKTNMFVFLVLTLMRE